MANSYERASFETVLSFRPAAHLRGRADRTSWDSVARHEDVGLDYALYLAALLPEGGSEQMSS